MKIFLNITDNDGRFAVVAGINAVIDAAGEATSEGTLTVVGFWGLFVGSCSVNNAQYKSCFSCSVAWSLSGRFFRIVSSKIQKKKINN